jgi:hypothetical protein
VRAPASGNAVATARIPPALPGDRFRPTSSAVANGYSFSNTATWPMLSDPNGSRFQPPQRARRRNR